VLVKLGFVLPHFIKFYFSFPSQPKAVHQIFLRAEELVECLLEKYFFEEEVVPAGEEVGQDYEYATDHEKEAIYGVVVWRVLKSTAHDIVCTLGYVG
jgi:hypothetical protein